MNALLRSEVPFLYICFAFRRHASAAGALLAHGPAEAICACRRAGTAASKSFPDPVATGGQLVGADRLPACLHVGKPIGELQRERVCKTSKNCHRCWLWCPVLLP